MFWKVKWNHIFEAKIENSNVILLNITNSLLYSMLLKALKPSDDQKDLEVASILKMC